MSNKPWGREDDIMPADKQSMPAVGRPSLNNNVLSTYERCISSIQCIMLTETAPHIAIVGFKFKDVV